MNYYSLSKINENKNKNKDNKISHPSLSELNLKGNA
jgi:hypothetical protein